MRKAPIHWTAASSAKCKAGKSPPTPTMTSNNKQGDKRAGRQAWKWSDRQLGTGSVQTGR